MASALQQISLTSTSLIYFIIKKRVQKFVFLKILSFGFNFQKYVSASEVDHKFASFLLIHQKKIKKN